MLNQEKQWELIRAALKARNNAHTPYSGFHVGAALLCADGQVIVGANVENASFGGTICAERSALCAAVSQGKREFAAIAIVGGLAEEEIPQKICPPCGICRQFMTEFCKGDFEVILFDGHEPVVKTLAEILPLVFEYPEG